MERQSAGIGGLIVAPLAGLAVGLPISLGSFSALTRSIPSCFGGTVTHRADRSLPEHSAADFILDLFDSDPDQISKDEIWSQQPREWSAASIGITVPYALRVIVATLPGPVAPALREKFDARMDAIQRRAGRSGTLRKTIGKPRPRLLNLRLSKSLSESGTEGSKEKGEVAKGAMIGPQSTG